MKNGFFLHFPNKKKQNVNKRVICRRRQTPIDHVYLHGGEEKKGRAQHFSLNSNEKKIISQLGKNENILEKKSSVCT